MVEFIIAGDYRQADYWTRFILHRPLRAEAPDGIRYVFDMNDLRAHRGDKVYVYGTAFMRRDYMELIALAHQQGMEIEYV